MSQIKTQVLEKDIQCLWETLDYDITKVYESQEELNRKINRLCRNDINKEDELKSIHKFIYELNEEVEKVKEDNKRKTILILFFVIYIFIQTIN